MLNVNLYVGQLRSKGRQKLGQPKIYPIQKTANS